MTLAEKIEAVLHYSNGKLSECPGELLSEVAFIKSRYSKLKEVECFETAERLARAEYIQRELDNADYRDKKRK